MNCEMCGAEVPACKKVEIEGTLMNVCSRCAKFGEETTPKAAEKEKQTIISQRLERREKRSVYKDIYEADDVDIVLVEDYPKKIMQARNSKRFTKKELAAKLNEKLSVIHKLERGEFRPSEKLIRKLERTLDITLTEKVKGSVQLEKKPYSKGVTLGDLIKLK